MPILSERTFRYVPNVEAAPIYLILGNEKHHVVEWRIYEELKNEIVRQTGSPIPILHATQQELDAVTTGTPVTSVAQGMGLYQATIEGTLSVLGATITSPEWWKKYLPWVGVGTLGIILIIILVKRKG